MDDAAWRRLLGGAAMKEVELARMQDDENPTPATEHPEGHAS